MATGTLSAGARHLRSEWGRWWRGEDLSDTHIAHRILNDQYRLWKAQQQQSRAEVQQNIGLLKHQQRQATTMQMQRMAMQKQMRGRGGFGGYGYGGGMGASPMISYRMMQWAQLQMRIGQQEFRHLEVTPSMLAIGRGQVRSRRHWAALAWLVALGAAWVGLWWVSVVGALTVAAMAVAFVAALAWAQGRNPGRRRPPVPKLLFVPPTAPAHTELEDADPEPFAIREAGNNPRVAREAVRLALKKEGARVAEVLVPEETGYGWRVPVVLESGTAGQFTQKLKGVATTLRVGESRLMARPADPNDAALMTMQILTRDPFEHPLPYPERPPGSCSILQPMSIGLSLEGETTPVVWAGQHALIVGDTGGGKSFMAQAIAEYVTACHDAVIADLDPVKRGLRSFAAAAAVTARGPEECTAALRQLLDLVHSRIAQMPPTQSVWVPTRQAPAVVAILDEYPKLTKEGKAAAIDLLRLGREVMVVVVILSQDATADVLSDAIADVAGVRIMMPCREPDVSIVVGQKDAISRGWLPHLLVPSPEPGFPADAGRFYAITPRHREPILRYVSPLAPEEAARRAAARVAAGLPELYPAAAGQADDVPATVRLLLDAFATHGDTGELPTEQIGAYLKTVDRQTWGHWDGRDDEAKMIGRALQERLKQEGVTIPTRRLNKVTGRPMGYRLNDVKDALP